MQSKRKLLLSKSLMLLSEGNEPLIHSSYVWSFDIRDHPADI
jgi:hypothetical protein